MSAREDYVEVAERLQEFLTKYPDGSLQFEVVEWREVGDQLIAIGRAWAYRTPDDPRPGVGWAQELVPGRTQFTRGSEVMNLETSAWGRAMAALGIATRKGIATGHEVRMARSRQQDDQYGQTRPVERVKGSPDDPANAPWQSGPPERPKALSDAPIPNSTRPDAGDRPPRPASEKSTKLLWALLRKTGMTDEQCRAWVAAVLPEVGPDWHTNDLTQEQSSTLIDRLKQETANG
jgi:hypothetical protein